MAARRRGERMKAMLVETSSHGQSRRWAVPSPAALREIAIFATAYLTYFGVRAITEGESWRAFENAMTVHRMEVELGVDWEGAIQQTVLGSRLLVDVTNAVYIYGHWPVLIGSGVLLFRRRRAHYYRLRNVCLLTGLIGLVVFTVFPVAPPRLTDLPVIDTVTRDSEGYRQLLPPSLVNQYAAMPSFHAGWNLLVGVIAFGASRNWLVRAFAVVMPASMAFAVVATANHFVVDVLAGITIVLVVLGLARTIERRRIDRGDVRDPGDRPPRRSSAIRRGASCGERPRAASRRRGARPSAGRG
jgi:membrane-associated phospholipid phosphatase